MKLNKLLTAVSVSAAAATAMTFASGASIKVVEQNTPDFTSASGMWMVMLYKGDGADVEVDYGLDVTKIAQVKAQFTTDDPDFFEGGFGGALVMSCGPTTITPADHNWIQKNWWGVSDDEKEIWTQDAEAPLKTEVIGDYTYQLTMAVDDSNCLYENSTYCQVALSEWGNDISQLVVLGMQFYDADGNEMISFDGNGKPSIPNIAGQAPADSADDADTDDAADDADADDADADDAADDADADDADADDAADDADADDADADDADNNAAPVVTTAPADEPAASEVVTTVTQQAPAAGNVDAATNSSKGSPDTGVADVAAIAGLAIVAGGAVLVAKKRK